MNKVIMFIYYNKLGLYKKIRDKVFKMPLKKKIQEECFDV